MKENLETPSSRASEHHRTDHGRLRTRWAAIGAAIAVALGAGGLSIVRASGEASSFVPITPCRVADTRIPIGPRAGPLDPNSPLRVPITGNQGQCVGIPATATAVSLNVTAVNPSASSFLTVWPAGQPRPNASSLNFAAGPEATPNAVVVALGTGGAIDVVNPTGIVELIIDVNGYFVAGAGAPGPAGPPGPAGRSAWVEIPAGLTVTGSASWRVPSRVGGQHWFNIDLPARASVQLTSSLVSFPASDSLANSGDSQCTGSPGNPTAPPGKVCVYRATSSFGVADLRGLQLDFQRNSGFIVAWESTTNSSTRLEVVWAYTQPG